MSQRASQHRLQPPDKPQDPARAAHVRAADDAPAGVAEAEGGDDRRFDMLEQLIAGRGALSIDQSAFVREAVRTWADGRGTLEACFGWETRRGERPIARRFASAKRQAALAAAFRELTDCGRLSNYARCEVLAAELADFERTYLPNWLQDGVPSDAPKLWRSLYDVFTALPDEPPAATARNIYRALQRARAL